MNLLEVIHAHAILEAFSVHVTLGEPMYAHALPPFRAHVIPGLVTIAPAIPQPLIPATV